MARVVWSSEATRILADLPASVRNDILAKSSLLADFPEMYPPRRRGRFRGQRYFVSFGWLVYYVIRGDSVAITTIGHARRRRA